MAPKTKKTPTAAKDPDADVAEPAPQPPVEDMDNAEDGLDDLGGDEEGGIRIGDIYIPPPPLPACALDQEGPRLVITHIENHNFKSYAGRQVLGPFHKSFTSIIGPNGSGKSNVIDSMLFVFGYRAQKIRSKSVAVLIHKSEDHPDVHSCSVAVHFQLIVDKGEDEEVVPGSQFVISRTAHRDNSSFYQVDGRRAPFRAVAKLLRGHGVDLDHNRFLILQGEVEQIAMMKPKAPTEHESGMLEFLEDIIGSSRYKEPTEVLSQRVDDLNTQRTEKLNRVKLVEKEKDELEGPKNEAVAYIQLENQLAQYKHTLQQLYISQAVRLVAETEEKKAAVVEEMGDLKTKLAELSAFKAERGRDFKQCATEYEEAKRALDKSVETVSALIKEDEKLVEDYRLINGRRKKAKESILVEKAKHEQLLLVPAKNTHEIDELAVVLADLDKQKEKEEAKVSKVMANLQTETQGLQDEKEREELELVQLRKVVNEAESQLRLAQSELDIFVSTETKERQALDTMRQQLQVAQDNHGQRRANLQQLEADVPEWQRQLAEAKEQLAAVAADEAAESQKLRALRLKLEEGRSALSANTSRSRVLDGLMEQKRRGNLPGIFGRLGDLGAIDEKYDVAVSTAAGALDHIVVDTVDTGSKCIQHLKANNLGIGSFIALEKQQALRQQAEQPLQIPEGVPRLYDLIRVKDERVKPAFYYTLRNTLVADNLEQATRIGYGRQRFRIVTLKGDMIEPSGTMSGGGNRCSRGRMGSRVATDTSSGGEMSAQEVALLEQQLEQLTQRVAQLRQQKVQLEERVERTQRDLRDSATRLQKWRIEIKALEEQQKALVEQIGAQEAKVKRVASDARRVKTLQAAVAARGDARDAAAAAASDVEAKVQALHGQIVRLTEGKMNSARQKLDAVVAQIKKVNDEKTKLSVAIRTSERNAAKTLDKVASLEQEVAEAETDLRQLQERRKQIEEQAMGHKSSQEALELAEKDLKAKLAQFKTELDAALKEENRVKAEKIDFDEKMDKFDGVIAAHQSKMEHWRREMAKLRLHPVGDADPGQLQMASEEELAGIRPDTLTNTITKTELELGKLAPNLQAIAEYRKKEELYLNRVAELDQVTKDRDEQRRNVETLRKARLSEFMSGFGLITTKLKELYQMITLGGDAELELVDSLDPFSEGIVFSVRPPKKTWKNISNLSGGEKTLSSLALVFALHYYKPTPLYVMDEIDAALDFKNVSIVGNYIRERTRNAQFIIISLRSNMFELADRLVGIYKTHNCTKSVAINPHAIDDAGRADAENRSPGRQSQPANV